MSDKKPGVAVALADLVSGGAPVSAGHHAKAAPPSPKPAPPPPPPSGAARRAPLPPSPAAQTGSWAGAVPRTRIKREQLNAGLPEELNILQRLRRYGADTGVPIQDFVADVLDRALTELGYPVDQRP